MKVLTWIKDNKIEDRIFDIAWIIFLLSRLFVLTAWCVNNTANGGNMENILQKVMIFSLVLFALVILIKLISKNYTWKILIFYAVFFIVAVICFLKSDSKSFLAYSIIFIAAYKLNGKRIISLSCIVYAAFFIGIILSCILKVSENILGYTGEHIRFGLGFNYCTTAPILLLFIFLQYLFLRKEKMKLWEYAIFEIINIVLYKLCYTQFAFWLMTAAIVFFAANSLFKNHWKILGKLKWLWIALPVVFCIVAILLNVLYSPENATMVKLDSLMHNRLALGKAGIDNYGIKAFGNNIVWIGNANIFEGEYNFVDCAYLQTLLRSGIVALVLIMAIYSYLVIRAAKKNDYYLVFIILIICAFCVTEPCLLDMASNTFPILAFTLLTIKPVEYKKSWFKDIFIEDISTQEQFLL